jgi:hypothetical protein
VELLAVPRPPHVLQDHPACAYLADIERKVGKKLELLGREIETLV